MRNDHQRREYEHRGDNRRESREDIYGYRAGSGGYGHPAQRGRARQENRAYPDDDEYMARRDDGSDDFDDIYGRGYGEGGFADGVGMDTGPDLARRAASNRSRRTLPKGYQRSDERIREDVCEQLSHSGLDVSDVSVEVSQGEVTLEGNVRDRYLKHAVENCADGCLGVKDVHNHLRVKREQAESTPAASDT